MRRLLPLNDLDRGVAGGGENLADDHLPGPFVQEEEIGEGAAAIDTGAVPSRVHTSALARQQDRRANRQTHESDDSGEALECQNDRGVRHLTGCP
jgi:hypothetical protein